LCGVDGDRPSMHPSGLIKALKTTIINLVEGSIKYLLILSIESKKYSKESLVTVHQDSLGLDWPHQVFINKTLNYLSIEFQKKTIENHHPLFI
jgi:hypothetical protein